MLGNLMYQTRPPEETIVFASGLEPAAVLRLREDFPHASVHARENRNDWGHEKRAEGVESATKGWLGFFNDDDWYDSTYVEKMMSAGELAEAVYCGWNRIRKPSFQLGSSTSGNFIVRTDLAQRLGYTSRRYEADGDFIDAIHNSGARVVFVDELLYAHNHQP